MRMHLDLAKEHIKNKWSKYVHSPKIDEIMIDLLMEKKQLKII